MVTVLRRIRTKVGGRHPPGLPDGRGAARQRDWHEVCQPLESSEVGKQELATPQGAIAAVARPVEGHSQHRTRLTVVGQAGCDMRVVMLHAHEFDVTGAEPVLYGGLANGCSCHRRG